jgi:hypothetical protein
VRVRRCSRHCAPLSLPTARNRRRVVRLENRRGADHHNAKFTAEQAAAICKRFVHEQPRPSIRALARELGVHPSTAHDLVRGHTYRK